MTVCFSGQHWLRRYRDERDWHDVQERLVVHAAKMYYPDDWQRELYNAKEGYMGMVTPYAEYMWLPEPADQEELRFVGYYAQTG
jgi:hypothetical protein